MAETPPGKHWTASDGVHVDVRGLAAPEPLVAILAVLEQPELVGPVIVHHFRDPVYLYPELAELGWTCKVVEGDAEEVRLMLTRRT
jgi:hypothetical protein